MSQIYMFQPQTIVSKPISKHHAQVKNLGTSPKQCLQHFVESTTSTLC